MKKGKTFRLSASAAIARIDQMIPLIEAEIRNAIHVEASLESANRIVRTEMTSKPFYGAECFNSVKFASQVFLAITIAKLFETPRVRGNETRAARLNRSDVASIPLLVRLMRQRRSITRIEARARLWMPYRSSYDETNARAAVTSIESAAAAFDALRQSTANRAALQKLTHFRNKYLAHILLDEPQDFIEAQSAVPTFGELHLLVDAARDIFQHARFAVTGSNWDLSEWEAERVRIADAFWKPALRAAVDANA